MMFTVKPGYVRNTWISNLLETAQWVGGGGGRLLRRRRHGDTKLERSRRKTRRRSLDLGTITKKQQYQTTFPKNSCYQRECIVLTVFDYCWNTEMNVGLSRYARWFLLLMLFIYAMLLWYSNDLQTHAVLDIEIRQYCIVGIILPKIPMGKWLHRTIFSFNSQFTQV